MAQGNSISLNVKNISLKELFNTIEAKTPYRISFRNVVIDERKDISLSKKRVPVTEILDEALKGRNLQYRLMSEKSIVISEKQSSEKQSGKTKKITGKVLDSNGETVIGANVLVKGGTTGTITNLDGDFLLEVPENSVLLVSFIGYADLEVPVREKTNYPITLMEDTKLLEEVVVIGYGTMKKKDLTGSVGSVKGADLVTRKTTQLSSALQGAVAGVMVTRDNNAPGASASSIKIRGVTTIGETAPLVIVDGVPGDINLVNSNDVESISVLKDAASASIYGSRAAAGVILITTKRAKENELSLSYNFEYGFEIPTKQPEYVGAQRFLEMTNELRYNDNNAGGWFQAYSEDDQNNWTAYHHENPNKYPMTDWTDLILKSSAPRQSHSLSIIGGSKVVKTKFSFSYDKTDGLYVGRSYERYMARLNNDFKINKYLGATLDVHFRRSQDHQPEHDPLGSSSMRVMPPTYAAVWSDGRIADGKNGENPYGKMLQGGTEEKWYNQIGAKASIDLTPLKGLKLSAVVAPTFNFNKTKTFKKAVPYTLADDPETIGGYLEGYNTTKLTEARSENYSVTSQFLANYTQTFGKHDLNLMAGYENYYYFSESLKASRGQYMLTDYPYLDLGPMDFRDNSGSAYEVAYRSFFGRVLYSYADRYLLQANVRRDGSSRFHKDHRWGTFPSFSAGWVISEEKFMKNANLDFLSFLKVRASWGALGNERIGNYPYQSTIAFNDALFYQNGEVLSYMTAAQQKYAIKDISWETTESFDFGLDASFLNNRLRLTADYYIKTTRDMLLALEIPDYIGYDNPDQNTGKMKTKGFELELGWNDRIGDFNYSVAVNLSDFVSEMGDLGGTEFLGDQIKKEGSEFNEWYGYQSEGLFLTQEDLKNSPKVDNNVKVGDIKYKDISGPDGVPDGKISSEYDRVLLGGSLPRYMFGGNINLGYKGFDFSMAIQGIGKQNVRMSSSMMQPLRENWGNMPSIIDGNYWSEKNTEEQNAQMKYPRMTYANKSNNYNVMSDYWLFDGHYFRLKNLTLGYTLPAKLTKKVSINKARFYVSANDLFCSSNYPSGWDPEMGSSSYPITTTLLFGISVNF